MPSPGNLSLVMAREFSFTAYEVGDTTDMPLVPAPRRRDWMDDTNDRFANRCLPLLIANQAGWIIPCPTSFTARWLGSRDVDGLVLDFGGNTPDKRVSGHFGHGVVTFSLPYLFRTPYGIDLWVKGPSNVIMDGAQALEGVVETDWSPASFTMNWKLTRPHHSVFFRAGQPICMIVPLSRGLAEQLDPRRRAIDRDAQLGAEFATWRTNRENFLRALSEGEPDVTAARWQKDYFRGRLGNGRTRAGHRTKLRLRRFE
jgi:hypothetical protein